MKKILYIKNPRAKDINILDYSCKAGAHIMTLLINANSTAGSQTVNESTQSG